MKSLVFALMMAPLAIAAQMEVPSNSIGVLFHYGDNMSKVAPNKTRIYHVFQEYSLMYNKRITPHLSAGVGITHGSYGVYNHRIGSQTSIGGTMAAFELRTLGSISKSNKWGVNASFSVRANIGSSSCKAYYFGTGESSSAIAIQNTPARCVNACFSAGITYRPVSFLSVSFNPLNVVYLDYSANRTPSTGQFAASYFALSGVRLNYAMLRLDANF
jgi:hypothetical protein